MALQGCAWEPFADARLDGLVHVRISGVVATFIPELASEAPTADFGLSAIDEWPRVLVEYFENDALAPLAGSTVVRRQLGGDPGKRAIWEDDPPLQDSQVWWRANEKAKHILIWCLKGLSLAPQRRLPSTKFAIGRMEEAAKLIPFVIRIADDYEPQNRTIGVACIEAFLDAVLPAVVGQMRLYELFCAILTKSVSFGDAGLRDVALRCLTERILVVEGHLWQSSDLASLLLREAAFSTDVRSLVALLEPLASLVRILQIAAVCHIGSILALLIDISEKTQRGGDGSGGANWDGGDDRIWVASLSLTLALIETCWPRLDGGRVDVIERCMSLLEARLEGPLSSGEAHATARAIRAHLGALKERKGSSSSSSSLHTTK